MCSVGLMIRSADRYLVHDDGIRQLVWKALVVGACENGDAEDEDRGASEGIAEVIAKE